MATGVSILKPLGYQKSKKCGYCRQTDGNSSYYLSCDNMRIDHYQELMDRGWRRSGTTYYKPDLSRSCCPHYTIRLRAEDFSAKKDQRSAINKLNAFVIGPEYKRKAAMLCPQPRDIKRQKRDRFSVIDAAHKAEYTQLSKPTGKKTQQPIQPAHKLEINLEPDTCTKEKHDILLRYQMKIHQDPESRWPEASFKRFLCSGLDRKISKVRGKTLKLGSYHQCYRLDGKLVAVGVLDLLPHAVSSVYLFYDPDYQQWDWGKISAITEIALAKEKGYQYYYMGYYIHSCTKMRYKGRFEPSYLLDPESLEWHPLDDEFRRRLDQCKYVSISAESTHATASQTPSSTSLTDPETTPSRLEEPAGEKSKRGANAQDMEMDSDVSDNEDTEIPEGSLLDYNVPGMLKKAQVSKLNLGSMKLLVRTSLVDLEDLRGWEEGEIDDPGTIKGIIAELVAATGPRLLKDTAVSLF